MLDNDFIPRVPNALPPGYRFDEFEIQEAIDASVTSILYRAWDHQLERLVAIREYMPKAYVMRNDVMELVLHSERDHLVYTAGLNSFMQEARQLAHFNHPNLPQVLRIWSDNNTAYIVTLFYSGMTLDELQKQQPSLIDEAWLRRMLPMLCGALATLHAAEHLHRNLSLKSIQIQDNGLPILLNTGAPRRGQGSLDEGNTLLHPGFAPLEQYTGDLASQLGPWTDIYAVGAVLYTLITGNAPPASVARSIQDSCVKLAESQPEGYSLNLLQAVDKALSLKPEDRPQSIDAFAALLNIQPGDVRELVSSKKTGTALVPVEDPDNTAVLPRWKRYQPALQIGAGAAAGLIVGAVLFGRGSPSVSSPKPAPASLTANQSPAQVSAAPAAAAAESTLARVYIRMNDGEQLAVNGKAQKLTPAANGFASLQLPAGKYLLTLSGGETSRKQTIVVANSGTWLVNPQE
ncbi:serine/threonine protein kinase [Cedecea neteri]|uniref:Serine/threonine protein kinase n=2 Tax=Cedecea neteri TaxID=158822 RepID=A0A291DX60_9ENTR|nr:protein kinase [Cedecea neteri]ATF92272.1 serine/threonine protein kinase [Cedecea neteri]